MNRESKATGTSGNAEWSLDGAARIMEVAQRGPDGAVLSSFESAERAALLALLRDVDDLLKDGHTHVAESSDATSAGFDAAERLADAAALRAKAVDAEERTVVSSPALMRLVSRPTLDGPIASVYALRGTPGAREIGTGRSFDDERRLAMALLARVGVRSERPALSPQDEAVRRSLDEQLVLLTGGPGTGKTRTIARMVVEHLRRTPEMRVTVMAPTGRAAVRLREQLGAELASIASALTVSTIHSAMRWRPTPGAPFAYDRENPLPSDLVIVDECSMVDLMLMRRLVEAVPSGAPLVLVGDAEQLASVEAGSIFADLCDAAPLVGTLVQLEHNYRTEGDPAAAWLATVVEAVRAGDGDGVVAALRVAGALIEPDQAGALAPRGRGVVHGRNAPSSGALTRCAIEYALPIFREIVSDAGREPGAAFEALGRFRVLAALRRGDGSAESIAAQLDAQLMTHRVATGRQLIILENDPDAELANGDMAVVLPDDRGELNSVVVGRSDGGALRRVPLSSLPRHDPAWAISIHKSQGSEYEHALVVLPPKDSKILSRELLYTALTRSRGRVAVVAEEASVRKAVERSIRRRSGLPTMLASIRNRAG